MRIRDTDFQSVLCVNSIARDLRLGSAPARTESPPVESENVLTMEDIDQNHGFINYRKQFPAGRGELNLAIAEKAPQTPKRRQCHFSGTGFGTV